MQKRSMRREVKHSFFFNISRQERLLLTQASFFESFRSYTSTRQQENDEFQKSQLWKALREELS